MKTVGILTWIHPINYGGVLQAYALRTTINKLKDCSAEIINFAPPGVKYMPYEDTKQGREQYRKKVEAFNRFRHEKCGISTPVASKVKDGVYDYYCAGSDQIWNPIYGYGNKEFLFPDFKDETKRIAYAAGIGTRTAEDMHCYASLFRNYVSKFKAVSVREQYYTEFIRKTCQIDCCCVLDPTLLLEEEEYEPLIVKERLYEEPFIFLYTLPDEESDPRVVEAANSLSRKYGLPIIHTAVGIHPRMINKNAGCAVYAKIEEFLWYIKNAAFVVTDSYHGTLLSKRFKTPFYATHRKGMETRNKQLIQLYDIGERFVDCYIGPEDLNDAIDFDRIEANRKKEKRKTMDFLKSALDIDE